MSSTWGSQLRLSLFGEAHGPFVGGTLHDFPAGIPLNLDRIKLALKLRQGNNNFTRARKEEDRPKILSGITKGVTNGAPITVIFPNPDFNKQDVEEHTAYPSRADYVAGVRYRGAADLNGGGHFSGRLTLPLVFFGMMAADYLSQKGIEVVSHIKCIGNVYDTPFGAEIGRDLIDRLNSASLATISTEARKQMVSLLASVKAVGDSIGGAVESAIVGLPAGIGSPMFDNLEAKLSSILFSIPAVKGVGFGIGHMFAHKRGSEVSDNFVIGADNRVTTDHNYNGGINGGISNGMPVIVTTSFKPTPSFKQTQKALDFVTNTIVDLEVKGNHVVSIVPRANIIVTSALSIAVLDAFLEAEGYRH